MHVHRDIFASDKLGILGTEYLYLSCVNALDLERLPSAWHRLAVRVRKGRQRVWLLLLFYSN